MSVEKISANAALTLEIASRIASFGCVSCASSVASIVALSSSIWALPSVGAPCNSCAVMILASLSLVTSPCHSPAATGRGSLVERWTASTSGSSSAAAAAGALGSAAVATFDAMRAASHPSSPAS